MKKPPARFPEPPAPNWLVATMGRARCNGIEHGQLIPADALYAHPKQMAYTQPQFSFYAATQIYPALSAP